MSSAVTTQVAELQNYVNGAWRRAATTEYLDVVNPATAEVLARTPLSTRADVDAAVQAAAGAFPAWRSTPPGERVQYLFKLKDLRRGQGRASPRHRKRRSRLRHPHDDAGL